MMTITHDFINSFAPHEMKEIFNISSEELDHIRKAGAEARNYFEQLFENVMRWLPAFYDPGPSTPQLKVQHKIYWKILFEGRIDQEYINHRQAIGIALAKVGVPLHIYFSVMNYCIDWWNDKLENTLSRYLFKICALDIAVLTASYNKFINDEKKGIIDKKSSILSTITHVTESIAKGDFSNYFRITGDDDTRLGFALNQMSDNFKEVVKHTKIIAQGKYDIDFHPLSERDELGKAIRDMTMILREMSEENKISAWVKSGQAELSNIIRGVQDLRELGANVMSYLIKYVNALMGTIYQARDEEILEMIGSFAYHRNNEDKKTISFGEGLVGQCAIVKDAILFSDVPYDYAKISSSLGEMLPKYIIVIPLLIEEEVIGVMELGSINPFDETKVELLRLVSENIAIAIKSSQDSQRMKILLEESKLSQNEIRAKNEELKGKTQFLEQQSKEIQEKSIQIENAKKEVERKAQELELASKYKSEFLANMSHELRTPLNSLLILSKLLADNEEKNLTQEQLESAKVIHKGGQDLLTLINDILDLSKVEAGKLQVNIDETHVRMIVENLRRQFIPITNEKKLQFTIVIEPDVYPIVMTDQQRIEQILRNFLSNSVKFTQQGSVTLRVHRLPNSPKFFHKDFNDDNCIAISVTDTGIGIPEEKLEIIFEAFQQGDGSTSRRYGGTGLGLSISRELAKLLGCEIHVQSQINTGSTFTLIVPSGCKINVSKEPEVFAKKEIVFEQIPDISLADIKVLVVDDDMRNTFALSGALRKKGMNVVLADHGKMALEKLETEVGIDIIIMDIMMPIMDGFEAISKIRVHPIFSHLPIIALTSKTLSEDKNKALDLGANAFVTKPVDLDMLSAIIHTELEKSLNNTV